MSDTTRACLRRPETGNRSDPDRRPGRIWHLQVQGHAVGSFTDLRNRRFAPGERLLDDQGNRRLVVAIIDEKALRMEVSRPLI